jgi:hypothetical protein
MKSKRMLLKKLKKVKMNKKKMTQKMMALLQPNNLMIKLENSLVLVIKLEM